MKVTGSDGKTIVKTIIELTGCNWKQASTAIQKVQNDSAARRNHDELISAICEQVARDREAEAAQAAQIMRDREAARPYEESTLTITYEYLSLADGRPKGHKTNFEKSVMPDNLRLNGVPLSIWEKVFVTSVNLLKENSFYNYYIIHGTVPKENLSAPNLLDFATLVSNFNAKANLFLNPYGILVQVGYNFQTLELKIVNKDGVVEKQRTKSMKNCLVFMVKFKHIDLL